MPGKTFPPRLTVAMIVRDVAETIAPALVSVRQIADEIIVVDTGSIDNSPAIAAANGAKVHTHAWQRDFSAARNAAWSHVTGDWILWLDGAETLPAESAQQLREFINTQADPALAYALPITVPAESGELVGEEVYRVRLVPNRADVRFAGRIRERLTVTSHGSPLATAELPLRIERSHLDTTQEIKAAKALRDLKILELEIQTQGQQPELLVALGETFAHLGELVSAAACFRGALARADVAGRVARAAYYGLLMTMDGKPANVDEQMGVCMQALEHFPLDTQLLCALGGYLQAQDHLELSARAYQTAWTHGEVDLYSWHMSDTREIAATCWSLVLQLQQDDDGALAVLESAAAQTPGTIRLRRHMIDLHIKHDRRKEALAEFDRLPAEIPHREALRSAVRGACLANRQNWGAALGYLRAAHDAGCRDSLCLRWLALALIATGAIEAADPIVRAWQAQEPRSLEARKYLAALEAGTLGQGATPSLYGASEGQSVRIDWPVPTQAAGRWRVEEQIAHSQVDEMPTLLLPPSALL